MNKNDLELINKIQDDIDEFMNAVFDQKKWDLIVPIMRKGLTLLANIPPDQQLKIKLCPFYGVPNIEEKSVLIIDDKAWHGHSMDDKYNEVLFSGVKKENVKTAALIKHSTCDFPINFFLHELDDIKYTKYEADLSVYYDSSCLQLDVDHLIAKTYVSTQSLDSRELERFPYEIEKIFSDLGIFYFQKSSAEVLGRRKFAVADIDITKLDLGDINSICQTEGVQKIRFCLESTGKLNIVPIFYPEIYTDQKKCLNIKMIDDKFCKQLDQNVPRSLDLCRECIDFNLQTHIFVTLFKLLTNRMRRLGFSVTIMNLSWRELEFKYPKIKSILDNIRKTIKY